MLARLRGEVQAGTPVVVDTIAGGLLPIGRVPALPGRQYRLPGDARRPADDHHDSQEGVAAVSANQVLTGIALIAVLAVGSQVLAGQLRIPALIVMLPAGFIAGLVTSDVNPSRLLGPAFQPLVALSVALILYDAGLGLDLHRLTGHTRTVVVRLIIVGVPLTWAVASLVAAALLGMPGGAALELGAILVVSGPTVVTPLLAFVRPVERLRRVLAWEGSLIDPVGGILGAVVFHGVLAGTHKNLGSQFELFLGSLGVGLAGAVVGTAALWLLLRVLQLGEVLGTSAQLAIVVGVAAVCDIAREDAGLIAAIIMGVAVANLRVFDIPTRRPFFETLVQLVIGLLFVSISATITPASLHHLVLPTLGLVAVLVLAVRPLVAALATLQTSLTWGERAFTGWMAPRGIVAAATATTFSAALSAHGVVGADKILPVTFLVIAVTVAVYGLSAKPVARCVGAATRPRSRMLLVGGDPWVVDLGCALRSAGVDVLLWAGHERERARIRQAHLELAQGELLASATGQGAQLEGVTAVLLLTGEDDFNALASILLEAGGEGQTRVYRLGPPSKSHGVVAPFMGSDVLFGDDLNRTALAARYRHGARITAQPAGHAVPDGSALLFVLRRNGQLEPATATGRPSPRVGETLILLGPGSSAAVLPRRAPLQDGDRVDRRAGAGRQPERGDDAQERPAAGLRACRGQLGELQVVEQVQAKRVDGEHVHREVDAGDRARGGVVVSVTAKDGDLALRQHREHRGVQAGPGLRRVPRALLGPPAPVPHAHEDDVAPAGQDSLVPLGREQVVYRHVVAWFQPRHAAGPWYVEEHPAPDDPVGGDADGQLTRPVLADRVRGDPVVQRAVEHHMAQGVDVAVGVAVDVHTEPVHAERQPRPGAGPHLRHLVTSGLGVVGRGLVLHRGGE